MVIRGAGTDAYGDIFPQEVRDRVWSKIPDKYRRGTVAKDPYGNQIRYEQFGNVKSSEGWDIDHRNPVSKNGSDNIRNLFAVQWYENRILKGDKYPYKQHDRLY